MVNAIVRFIIGLPNGPVLFIVLLAGVCRRLYRCRRVAAGSVGTLTAVGPAGCRARGQSAAEHVGSWADDSARRASRVTSR